MPTSAIEQRELAGTPVLYIRREIPRGEIAATIGQCLGALDDDAWREPARGAEPGLRDGRRRR